MNTGILITSTWLISFSIALYLMRKYKKAESEEHKLKLRLWETTHTFSEWAEKGKRKAKLSLVKK